MEKKIENRDGCSNSHSLYLTGGNDFSCFGAVLSSSRGGDLMEPCGAGVTNAGGSGSFARTESTESVRSSRGSRFQKHTAGAVGERRELAASGKFSASVMFDAQHSPDSQPSPGRSPVRHLPHPGA